MDNKIEEKRLEETLKVIELIHDDLNKDIHQSVVSIQEFKKYIWETRGEMDAAEVRDNRERAESDVKYTNHIFKKLNQLQRAKQKPYFGRIDFQIDDDLLEIYIGICGIEKDFNHYIYDWRTPIASLFYNYGIGNASYASLNGNIDGKITLKRQYKIEDGKLKHAIDNDVNIDDVYLQNVLAESRTDKMKNIVNTIQKEQNEVIRNVMDKILIVQGSAGSGKTSVALHRIAYLLYQDKELSSNEVIIFSPNDVFSNYISNVLPELGEDNVLETTFSEFAKSYMSGKEKVETYTEFSERYYKNSSITNYEFDLISAKLSDKLPDLMLKYLEKLGKEIKVTRDLIIDRKDINIVGFDGAEFEMAEINEMLNEKLNNISLGLRLDYIGEKFCDRLGISYKKYTKTIKKKLKEIINYDISLVNIYNDILSSKEFAETFGIKGKKIAKNIKKLNYEDAAPLLFLEFELNEYPTSSYIKQVVLDEAQDYTKMQYMILNKIFRSASFTILGDSNQTISPFYKYKSLEDMSDVFNQKVKYIELNKTYRSTPEIVNHNNKILDINTCKSVRKESGNAVEYIENSTLKDLLNELNKLKEEGLEKLAIITKNEKETKEVYNYLIKYTKINLVSSDASHNIVVLPVYLSKGLEFDGVIVYTDKLNPYKNTENNLFYVACTRAQHKLIICNQKKF